MVENEMVIEGERVEILKELIDAFVDGGNGYFCRSDPSDTRRRDLMQKVQRDLLFADRVIIIKTKGED